LVSTGQPIPPECGKPQSNADQTLADLKKSPPPPAIGVCDRCNAQFKSNLSDTEFDIAVQFDAHKCKPVDGSQNALRIVRESTEDK
jgi:hypothetical protein